MGNERSYLEQKPFYQNSNNSRSTRQEVRKITNQTSLIHPSDICSAITSLCSTRGSTLTDIKRHLMDTNDYYKCMPKELLCKNIKSAVKKSLAFGHISRTGISRFKLASQEVQNDPVVGSKRNRVSRTTKAKGYGRRSRCPCDLVKMMASVKVKEKTRKPRTQARTGRLRSFKSRKLARKNRSRSIKARKARSRARNARSRSKARKARSRARNARSRSKARKARSRGRTGGKLRKPRKKMRGSRRLRRVTQKGSKAVPTRSAYWFFQKLLGRTPEDKKKKPGRKRKQDK